MTTKLKKALEQAEVNLVLAREKMVMALTARDALKKRLEQYEDEQEIIEEEDEFSADDDYFTHMRFEYRPAGLVIRRKWK